MQVKDKEHCLAWGSSYKSVHLKVEGNSSKSLQNGARVSRGDGGAYGVVALVVSIILICSVSHSILAPPPPPPPPLPLTVASTRYTIMCPYICISLPEQIAFPLKTNN
ncbi:unnamed protein product, partial [Iphiclides podalirius]